jgi:hypothetical protein
MWLSRAALVTYRRLLSTVTGFGSATCGEPRVFACKGGTKWPIAETPDR